MTGLFGFGGSAQRDSEPSESVLAEWNKYTHDEPAGSGASTSDGLVASMEEGKTMFSNFVSNSFKTVSTTVGEGGGSLQRSLTTVASARFVMPTGQQIAYFACFLGAGLFFLFMAFSLFLPMIIVVPAKFASAFSLGSVLILSAFAALRGWRQQLEHMMTKERLPFSIGYLASIAATMYTALFMHSYIFSLVCCGLQVLALLYYVCSYFPGGPAGAQYVLKMFWQAIVSCFGTVLPSK